MGYERVAALLFSVLMMTSVFAGTVALGAGASPAATAGDDHGLDATTTGDGVVEPASSARYERGTAAIEEAVGGTGVQPALQAPGFQKETVIDSINQPMAFEFLPDGRVLILKKSGEMLIADPDTGQSETYMTLNGVNSGGESGLLDVTLDPNFEQNGYFYLYWTTGNNRISRFTHQENQGGLTSTADQSSEMIVWENDGQASNGHVGGGLDFGPQGALWLTVGEQFNGDGGQDPSTTYGKVIRVNPDGTIPDSNPYVGDGDPDTLPEVFALGLRNPFTASWDLQGDYQRFSIGDVGGNQGNDYEEINVLTDEDIANASNGDVVNFGWNECEGVYDNNNYPTSCPLDNHREPFWDYEHTSSDVYTDGSIIDGDVYYGQMFPAEYQGAYFFGDQSRDWIKYATFHQNGSIDEVQTLADDVEGPVHIDQGPDGALYYLRYSYNGPQDFKKITYEDPTDTTPEVEAGTTSLNVENGSSETVQITASDADGDSVDLSASGLPAFASFTDNGDDTGTLSLSPGSDDDGPYQVTVAGEDDDGNQDQVTIDVTVYEAGEPTPDDFDGDGTPNGQDPDDDNDGTPDTADPFPLDPNDGVTTPPPVHLDFEANSYPNTVLGLGFTGVMNNGDGYEQLYDPSEVTIDDSSLTIENVDGYPDNEPSNQMHGYQVGIDPPEEPFAINTTVSGLPENPQAVQILGLHMGTGDQSNYAKFVIGDTEPRLEFSHEVDGQFTYESDENSVPELTGPNDPKTELSLVVYPDQGLVEAWYKPEGGEWTFYADKDIAAIEDWLDTSDGSGLAVGLQATSNTASFDATFHHLTVQTLDSIGGNSAPTADAGTDQTVEEGATVTLDASGSSDPDPGDTLGYQWTQQSGPGVSLSDATAAQPTFTAPDVDGDGTLTFEVAVDDGQASATDTVTVTVEDSGAGGSAIPNAIAGEDDVIGSGDLQDAMFYWQSGDPVPGTDGATIDSVGTLQDLVFHWQSGTVFDANQPPTAEITMPADGDTFQSGDTIQFQGTASDPEDGALTGSNLEWSVGFLHNTHAHPKQSGITGESGSFEATIPPDHDPSDQLGFQIDLTATDSEGATASDTVVIDPERSTLSLETTPVDGIDIEVGTAPYTTPTQYSTVVGVEQVLSAPASACVDGTEYSFDGWADGTATADRAITAPAADTTYTADYSASGPCEAHSARIAVTEGFQNKDTSPWLFEDSVNVTNTGTVAITSVTLDVSSAALPDVQAVGLKDGYTGSASGQTMTIDFSGDPVAPGESALGNVDFNHDTSGGVSTSTPCPCHQAYEISGLEMVGTTVTVEYDDGVTQTTEPFSDGSPGGGVAVADGAVPSAPELHFQDVASFDGSVLGAPHRAATVSQAHQEVLVHGPAGATVRVLRLEGQMNVTGTPGDTIGNVDQYIEEPYEANRFYIEKSEQVVTLDAQGEATTTVTLTNDTDTSNQNYAGVNYVTAVVEDGDGDTGMTSDVAVLEYAPGTANQPPTADAGADQTVEEGATVTLDASGSSDPDPGDTLGYQWSQQSGPGVSLSDATAAQPTFTAPDVDGDGTLTFEVAVNDGTASDTDTVTVTVQDTDAVSPNDFDGDGVLNANDPDDDNDGADDTVDHFAIDPDDGTTTSVPVELDFEADSYPNTIMGVGFTGLMNNGQDYQDLYDPSQVTVEDSSITVEDVGPTYPDNNPSNLEYGFQTGFTPPSEPFRVNTTVSGLPSNPQAVQVFGMQLGTGDQNNYMKLMVGSSQPKVEFSHEYGDGFVTDPDETAVPGLAGPDKKTNLSMVVYPSNNTVEAYYQTQGGDWTYYADKTMPQDWLDTSDGSGLAVGLVATSTAGPFDATWHHLTVETLDQGDDEPTNTAPTADAGIDQTVEEGATVTLDASGSSDPDPGDTLGYQWTQQSGPGVSLSDATAAQPTFTAPDVDGDGTLTFEVAVDDGTASDTDTVTVTVQDTDAVSPNDFDGDGVLNANDPDDDNDGADDTVDPFAIDPDNGTTTDTPVTLEFEQNSYPNTIMGVGFTGMMVNGTDYGDLYEPSKVTVENSSITVEDLSGLKVPEDPYSNLAYGFQFGVDAPGGPFAVNTTVSGMPANPQDTQIIGLQIGPGDQDNFYKFVYGASEPRIEFSHEFDGNWNYDDDQTAISGLTGPDKKTQLSLVVYPDQNKVEAWYKPEGGEWTLEGTKTNLPADWVDSSDGTGLAVGTLATSTADPFDPTWHNFTVEKIDQGSEHSSLTTDAESDRAVEEGTQATFDGNGGDVSNLVSVRRAGGA
jgi:glucose/arabinose dehydrogenase